MTLNEAKSLTNGTMVHHVIKKNVDGTPMRARVTGIKTWKSKRNENRVEVHVKHGLYDYAIFYENELDELEIGDGREG